MYTFVCAQQFRRDEYQWHSKNVHDDILGGMNNWMEHRCPMSSYGCGFSMRRMYPKCDEKSFIPKNTIVFSPGVESFGVAPMSSTNSKNTQMDKRDTKRQKAQQSKTTSIKAVTQNSKSSVHITDLPYEILFQITQHLESFRYIENMAFYSIINHLTKLISTKLHLNILKPFHSICNLAVTCTYMRNICCSLLDTRGCVTLRWQRLLKDGKRHWEVAYRVRQ